jgi:hypothetical protein
MEMLKCRYGIMAHVVHLVNREYGAMARDYYTLGFLDSVSTGNGTFVCKTTLFCSPQSCVNIRFRYALIISFRMGFTTV